MWQWGALSMQQREDGPMDQRRNPRTLRCGLAAMALAVAGVAVAPSFMAPASGQDPPCPIIDGFRVCDEIPGNPGTTTTTTLATGPPDPDPGAPVEPDPCPWERHPDQSAIGRFFPDAPPDAILLTRQCGPYACAPPLTCSAMPTAETTWVLPGEEGTESEPVPPSPELVAQWLMATVPVERPDVVVHPAVDVAAILEVPSFIQVTNWVGQQTPRDCLGGVCVSITATPTLSFDPGESDPATGWTASTVPCEAPGTQFDPDSGLAGTPYDPGGAEPRDQAEVQGACAHAYRLRTGVGERPGEWPGSVSITWEATWSSDVSGVEGEFDPITMSTDVPRQVDEIQAPVVDATLGGAQ
jgi:hypothetical protein